ncbi:MAG TPA: CehA/McbA family metallohydrolase, partial [Candidatus Limnocylindrales bacterium]
MKGVWLPQHRAEEKYRYIPVEVGRGGFEVTLSHRGGVLDLGVFDPSGRFRGYSGGARSRFSITPEWATPGYLPGGIEPGEWSVFLGLHRVPADGVEWEITVGPPVEQPVPQPPPVPQRVQKRRDVPPGWFAGDLHAHTVHSDGSLTIEELAALAASSGLDFLAVTDHNTVSHHPHLAAIGRRYGVELIPGQEVTTDRGHANVFGDSAGWVDFREPPQTWDGLMSINHPLTTDCSWRMPVPPTRLAEVWHSGWWDRTWSAPLAWLLAWDPSAAPIGGSDFHDPAQTALLGRPTTWVKAESPEQVWQGLAAGRTAVSESPDGPLLLREG